MYPDLFARAGIERSQGVRLRQHIGHIAHHNRIEPRSALLVVPGNFQLIHRLLIDRGKRNVVRPVRATCVVQPAPFALG